MLCEMEESRKTSRRRHSLNTFVPGRENSHCKGPGVGLHGLENHAANQWAALPICPFASHPPGGLGPTGVIRSLHSLGRLECAFCTETRPYNQGARLTAFEFVYEQIPATLIADSMAAAAMAHYGVSGQQVGRASGQGSRHAGPGGDSRHLIPQLSSWEPTAWLPMATRPTRWAPTS